MLYTTPLSSMICEHAIPHHLYADDSQLYVSFASRDSAAAMNGLQSCLASVQSWMSMNKLKLNPDKTEFFLMGANDSTANTSLFLIELLGVRTNPAKSARNLGAIFAKIAPSAHAFTIWGICGVFAVTLIWIVQNCLQLLSCPVVSIIAIHFCMVLLTLTSQGFSAYRINWPAWWQSLFLLLAVFHCFVPFICCQYGLEYFFKINVLTYKTLREKQPVYLHSMLATSIPSRSLRSNNDNSLSVPRVKTNTGARAFHCCAPSLWNNLPLSVRSAISFATFKRYLKTHLFDLAFPHRYHHSPWPVDVTELFPWFGCSATEPGFA